MIYYLDNDGFHIEFMMLNMGFLYFVMYGMVKMVLFFEGEII